MVAMLIVCSRAMAQTPGLMFLGASVPMKDYATFTGFDDYALMSTNAGDNKGGAGVGFNVGVKWYFNVGVEDLDVILSADCIYNGPSGNLTELYHEMESVGHEPFIGGKYKYESTPKYINIPAMLGMNYTFYFNPNLGVFVEAGAGVNVRFITSLETFNKGELLGVATSIRETQTYDEAFSFAYQIGCGIEVARNLVIGCSFYDLGETNVKGELTTRTANLEDYSTHAESYYNTLGKVHPMMVVARVGFGF